VGLALELRKPLFMHCRDAGEKFAEVLRSAARDYNTRSSSSGSAAEAAAPADGTTSSTPFPGETTAAAAAAAAAAAVDAHSAAAAPFHLPTPGVLHCFTGDGAELAACLDLGLHIGITGWVCDDRPERGGAELASLLKTIPPGRLMIETDAPYLVPRTIKPSKARPHRNEPALLPHVLRAVAEACGEEEAAVAMQTTRVAGSFFQLPSSVWTALR